MTVATEALFDYCRALRNDEALDAFADAGDRFGIGGLDARREVRQNRQLYCLLTPGMALRISLEWAQSNAAPLFRRASALAFDGRIVFVRWQKGASANETARWVRHGALFGYFHVWDGREACWTLEELRKGLHSGQILPAE